MGAAAPARVLAVAAALACPLAAQAQAIAFYDREAFRGALAAHELPGGASLSAGRTRVDYARGDAAGMQAGSIEGWGPRIGLGLQLDLNERWGLRFDVDRYRLRVPAGGENVDTVRLGAQYSFH